ncbi:MAG: AAA family ATPase [Chthonomonadales bacterium]|nr:AAA family ATPase [Chthonomonadales bacterium]
MSIPESPEPDRLAKYRHVLGDVRNYEELQAVLAVAGELAGGPAVLAEMLRRSGAGQDAAGPVTCMTVDAWALRCGESVDWLVPGLIPRRHMTLLVGAQKSGKSTLLRNLIAAVTTRGDFLGRPAEHGAAVYLALEEHPGMVVGHLRALGADLSRVIVPTTTRTLDYQDADGKTQRTEETTVVTDMQAIEDVVRRERPLLLAVDPLVKLVRIRDWNAYEQVYAALDPLLRLALVYGVAVVVVHHSGKNAADRENVGHRAVGSVALPSVVMTTLSMTKRGDVRVLENEGRGTDDIGKLVLTYDPASGRMEAAGTYAELASQRAAETLLDAAEAHGGPFTRPELLDAVDGNRQDLHRGFNSLVGAGRFARVSGAGRKGDPFRYELVNAGSAGSAGSASYGGSDGSRGMPTRSGRGSELLEPPELAELAELAEPETPSFDPYAEEDSPR